MKEGVLYLMFLLIIMTFAITEQGSNEKPYSDTSTRQSISVNNEIKCIIPQFYFSLKKITSIVLYSLIENPKNLEEKWCCRFQSTLFISKWNNLRTLDLKPLIAIPIKPKLYNSSKSKDEHHLS